MSFEVNYTLEDEQLFLTEPRFLRHEIIALLIYHSIVFYAQNTKLQVLTVRDLPVQKLCARKVQLF